MSRAARKQLFSMTDSLIKANKGLKMSLPQADVKGEGIVQLLSDCQDAAVAIGNSMEVLCGEGTQTVAELEAYCENLYQMALSLESPKRRKELAQELTRQLLRIRRHIDAEVPDRLEAVFLPYKASMWDSLESIWMAADADEECDAYVIPIPYYDKDPGDIFKEEHYEGDEFPEYVPITHYEKYDFSVRQPDIIFIHNGYDNGNYVTSVHPYFYCKNLKQFTDKLVYIPYFVMSGEGIDEFYSTPMAILYADYIIAQTEKERQDYIRYCTEAFPEGNFEKKVLALGSPKFDKVRSVNRDNVAAPKEWMERIGGKKVILYNTSITAMLQDTETYLSKMQDVFSFFQSREDAVLLWRPHPLMENTLWAMCQEKYDEYIRLKEWYKDKNVGIYDDTPDMYTAIGLSDAYYGDRSSLVWLYRETGKPVMIQDVSIREAEEEAD